MNGLVLATFECRVGDERAQYAIGTEHGVDHLHDQGIRDEPRVQEREA